MMITKDALRRVLALGEMPLLSSEEMAKDLIVTFFPYKKEVVSKGLLEFSENLRKALIELGATVLPFEEVLTNLPFRLKIKWIFRMLVVNFQIITKRSGISVRDEHILHLNFPFRVRLGKKIKTGVVIIATGEGGIGNLPMDYTMSFKENPIVTVLDKPKQINELSDYIEHMEVALKLFAWHMTNLVITVAESSWTIYSFNGSYPTYSLRQIITKNVLDNLIPKIAAPVRPPRLEEFEIRRGIFDVEDEQYKIFRDDLVEGGVLLEKTGLYPRRKTLSELPFRNNFYRWVGSIHLDKRSGMSYGFVARQLPVKLSPLIPFDELDKYFGGYFPKRNDIVQRDHELYILIHLHGEKYYLRIPEVWVLTSKSGADKSQLNKYSDIIKMGLVGGRMVLETPKGINLEGDYKPSFDTKVILAHALGNAIFGSVIAHLKPKWQFPKILERDGMALVHWHGYINPQSIPPGWIVHGENNPPVSCSSPQSAVYAFRGKEAVVLECLTHDKEYRGDIHVEPHHGSNITFNSIRGFANFLLSDVRDTRLG